MWYLIGKDSVRLQRRRDLVFGGLRMLTPSSIILCIARAAAEVFERLSHFFDLLFEHATAVRALDQLRRVSIEG